MPSELQVFLENLLIHGLEHYRKYYGVYRGIVVNNKDPEKRGRIQAFVPEVGQRRDSPPQVWIDPAFDGAGASIGTFNPPEENETVRVMFSNGDPSQPVIYYGGWFGQGQVPKKLGYDEGGSSTEGTAPIKRGLRTKAGHTVVLNDKVGQEALEVYWKDESAFFKFDKDATFTVQTSKSSVVIDKKNKKIVVTDENGSTITMDPAGIKLKTAKDINLEGKNITLKGDSVYLDSAKVKIDTDGSQGVPRGQDLLQYINTHNHPTGVGPSGPPIRPMLPTVLSKKSKVD